MKKMNKNALRFGIPLALLLALASTTLPRWGTKPSAEVTRQEGESSTASPSLTFVPSPLSGEGGDDGVDESLTAPGAIGAESFRRLRPEERARRLEALRTAVEAAASDGDVRQAAEALVLLDHAEALEALVAVHAEADSEERRTAIAAALQATPGTDQEARELITSIVASPLDASLRREASDAVARFANGDTVAHLLELRAEEGASETAAREIERCLSGIRNPAAAEALGNLIGGPDRLLSQAALAALRELPSPESAEALVAAAARAEGDENLQVTLLDLIGTMRFPIYEDWMPPLVAEETSPLHAAVDLMIRSSSQPLPPHRM
jgi:hypothetical protein